MSYYKCTKCDEKHKIFGLGYTQQLKESFGIKNSFEVPIVEEIASMSDSGTPFVLTLPENTDLVQTYHTIAKNVINEVKNLDKAAPKPEVKYEPSDGLIHIIQGGKITKKVSPYDLRLACKCAGCIDEFNGKQILKVEQVPLDVYPKNMMTKGNYAVAVVWSDGHKSSIYPFSRIMSSEIPNH